MNIEKWNEICFLHSEVLKVDLNERGFGKNVVLPMLRILGWKEYKGEIEKEYSFQLGSAKRLRTDYIIKSQNQRLFVIEIKRPNNQISSVNQEQLFSYMRQLKLDYGLLIGEQIQVFYDGNLNKLQEPMLLETISFKADNEIGLKFIELFGAEGYSSESLRVFTTNCLKRINRKEERKKLTQKILSKEYQEQLKEFIKQDLSDKYDVNLIESLLNEMKIELKNNNLKIDQSVQSEFSIKHANKQRRIISNSHSYSNVNYSNGVLPIELNPPLESDFKRRLLSTKTAYITIFYNNGISEQRIWNAHQFSETSGVFGNLRSRPEFRQGEWQKRGIKKVYVSINKYPTS